MQTLALPPAFQTWLGSGTQSCYFYHGGLLTEVTPAMARRILTLYALRQAGSVSVNAWTVTHQRDPLAVSMIEYPTGMIINGAHAGWNGVGAAERTRMRDQYFPTTQYTRRENHHRVPIRLTDHTIGFWFREQAAWVGEPRADVAIHVTADRCVTTPTPTPRDFDYSHMIIRYLEYGCFWATRGVPVTIVPPTP